MKKIGYIILSIYLLACIVSCEKELIIEFEEPEKFLIVDGFIENNKTPYVLITYNTPFFGSIDSLKMKDLVITIAKITVSTDDTSEILTLTKNETYFPPYVYRGTYLTGETGKTYTLTIELTGKSYTATTTIPEPPSLNKIWMEKSAKSDTMSYLWVELNNNINTDEYFRFSTKREGVDKNYIPSLNNSALTDVGFNDDKIQLAIYKGIDDYYNPLGDIYFNPKDTISVKVSTMDFMSYQCWNSIQEEMLNYANPFAMPNSPVVTNISGGLGVWSGFGSRYYASK